MERKSKSVLIGLAVLIGLFALFVFGGQFVYVLKIVEEQEVGVQFRGGRIHDIVGPGVYSDFGLFVKMQKVSTQAIAFEVSDPEIITKDKQRIGLVVSGLIFRPGLAQKDIIRENWSSFRGIYLDDAAASKRIQDLAKQSMKVCVGDRTFDDNIIGASRDALRTCIDDEINLLANELGLRVENVVVPNVVLSAEVQLALDAIVQSRLETEKAAQDQLKAQAEAAAEQARQEGEIRVEQSRIQEQTRQQITLAELEQQRLAAQTMIIEAKRANSLAELETERVIILSTKANELLAAEQDLEINAIKAEAAAEQAKVDLALEVARADLLTANPSYLQWQIIQANASALSATDKIIFTTEGTTPTIVVPGPGIIPTVDTTPNTPE